MRQAAKQALQVLSSLFEADRVPPSLDTPDTVAPAPNIELKSNGKPFKCPPGFKFDGKSCVSILQKKKKSDDDTTNLSVDAEGAPTADTNDDSDGFPKTRHQDEVVASGDIAMVPDPKSEVMQLAHNAATYFNGQRSFEYAEEQWKEYALNSFVLCKFPDAFQSKDEFIKAFLTGKHEMNTDWTDVENCSASSQELEDYDGLFTKMQSLLGAALPVGSATGKDEESKTQLDAWIAKADGEQPETTPPAIVGMHQDDVSGKGTLWMISGNTRSTLYAYLGKPLPTRIVQLAGRMLPDPTDSEMKSVLWVAEREAAQLEGDDAEMKIRSAVEQVLQARQTAAPAAPGLDTPPAVDGSVDANASVAPAAPGVAPAPAAPAAPAAPPASPAAESIASAMDAITQVLEATRSYPSGQTKRQYRKYYTKLGYPVGTVRTWSRGKVVKTQKGWEPTASTVKASAAVPAAKHDEPTAATVLPAGSSKSKDTSWVDAVPGLPADTRTTQYKDAANPKPQREKLHAQIISKVFDKVPSPDPEKLKTHKPVAIMLMGGPASGKSTIGGAYPDDKFVHLDADALKHQIPEYRIATKWRAKNAAKMAHEESINLMQKLREKTIASKKNLVMDGTGRHLSSYLKMIDKLKAAGYHVKVVMADVDRDTAKARAHDRAKVTGRWVPDQVIDDAYRSVPQNFEPIAKQADSFELWDTRKQGKPELKWSKTDGQEKIHDQAFVDSFKHANKPAVFASTTPYKGYSPGFKLSDFFGAKK